MEPSYLIVKATPLNDQYECDADRTPLCITSDDTKYQKYGYEVYRIFPNGSIRIIQDYDDFD